MIVNYVVTVFDIFDESVEYEFAFAGEAEMFAQTFLDDCETVSVSITNLNTEEVTIL